MNTSVQSENVRPTTDPIEMLLGPERLDNQLQVFQLIETGFPIENVARVLAEVSLIGNQRVLDKIIGMSARTLARRVRHAGSTLSPSHSARLLAFLQILNRAESVFGTRQYAEAWMLKPALGLEGYAPADLLINPMGQEIVSDFLSRIEHGVYQ